MELKEVLDYLAEKGSEQIKNIFKAHGAQEPLYGVRVQDLKLIQKKVKKDYSLSMALFDTGNYDAMYLAGLIADEKKMSKQDLQHWAKKANAGGILEYTVAWIASESAYGWELGNEWIKAEDEKTQSCGWATLASCLTVVPNEKLPIKEIKKLMQQVEKEIHTAHNRVRYCMNTFLLSCGICHPELTEEAKAMGERIGKVIVHMGKTQCKVPYAPEYIANAEKQGKIGNKKKTARC